MARFLFECFGNLTYDKELTYEEVLTREEQLKLSIQTILEDNNAVHIDFVPLDDTLQIQCAFTEMEAESWTKLCSRMAKLAVKGIRGRLLLVERTLDSLSLCVLVDGKYRETQLPLRRPERAMVVQPKIKQFKKADTGKERIYNPDSKKAGGYSTSPSSRSDEAPDTLNAMKFASGTSNGD